MVVIEVSIGSKASSTNSPWMRTNGMDGVAQLLVDASPAVVDSEDFNLLSDSLEVDEGCIPSALAVVPRPRLQKTRASGRMQESTSSREVVLEKMDECRRQL